MLELAILEQNPIFILDTNSLNKFPLPLLKVLNFYCPQGVAGEVERWGTLLETLPEKIAQKEGELEAESQPLKIRSWLEEVKKEENYARISELVERKFLQEKIAELEAKSKVAEWEEIVRLESQKVLDDFERERQNYNLEFAKGALTYVLNRKKRLKVEAVEEEPELLESRLGGRGDLIFVSVWCQKAAEELSLEFEKGDDYFRLGAEKGAEEEVIQFFSYRFLTKREESLSKKREEIREIRERWERLRGREEERENAFKVVQELRNADRIVPKREDWITGAIHSCTGLLGKTLARDAVKEFASNLARGERNLPFFEKGIELYRKRRTRGIEEGYEEKLKGKLKTYIFQLLERITKEETSKEAEAQILALAEDFQSEESLRVDVEVLRTAFQKSEEFPQETIFIVTDDADLTDLFSLTRDLRQRLFQNVRLCDVASIVEFYSRLKEVKQRLEGLE